MRSRAPALAARTSDLRAFVLVATLPVPNPRVDRWVVEQVEKEYRRRYFRPRREIEQQTLNPAAATLPVRRSGRVRV